MSDRVDFWEAAHTFSNVGAGSTADQNINIQDDGSGSVLRIGFHRTKIFELTLDGPSDFDVEIYEDDARTQLNRVFRIQNVADHRIERLLDGLQYRDRDAPLLAVATFHVRVRNNTAGAANIVVRIRHLPFFAR